MKLQHAFHTMGEQGLDRAAKARIYDLVLTKKTLQERGLKRTQLIAKVAKYAGMFAVLALALYVPAMWFQSADQNLNGVQISRMMRDNAVQADYVGRIVSSVGPITISNSGTTVSTDFLKDGDKLTLWSGATLSFEISSGTNAKIVGPAVLKLSIQQTPTGKSYGIDLLEGELLTLESTTPSPDAIEVTTPKYRVSVPAQQAIHLSVTTKDAITTITNNGAHALAVQNLQTDEMVAIENNFSLASDQDKARVIASIGQQISHQTLSTSSEVSGAALAVLPQQDKPVTSAKPTTGQPMMMAAAIAPTTATPTASDNARVLVQPTKAVLTPDQQTELNVIFSDTFVANDVQGVASGDAAALQSLYQRLVKAYKLIGQPFTAAADKAGIANGAEQLIKIFERDYFVPPSITDALQSIDKSVK